MLCHQHRLSTPVDDLQALDNDPVLRPLCIVADLLDGDSRVDRVIQKDWPHKTQSIIAVAHRHRPTSHWLSILEPADVWWADVLTWDRLFAHDAFRALNMVQTVDSRPGAVMRTTRCPMRIDGEVYTSSLAAPRIGEHNELLAEEFDLT